MAKRRDDWLVKASLTWDLLSKFAARRELANYKQVGDEIGLHHRVMSYPLGLIQDYCLEERLPVLAAIVVSLKKGVPGGRSVAAGRDDIDEMQTEVFNYPWASRSNPFAQFAPGEDLDTFTNEIIRDPNQGSNVYGRVLTRGVAHQVFRNAVSRVYKGQCAMCGLSFGEALEAAHIIRWPDATQQQRMDPRNGLLLCATHHKLFDATLITVTENYLLKYYDPKKTEGGPYSKADVQMTVDLHEQKLNLPADQRHWPKIEWLKERNIADGWDD